MAVIASMVIRSAMTRKESRGAHYVIDYPQVDETKFNIDTII